MLLLDRGADVNSRGTGGDSALMVACRAENEDLVRIPLDQEADVNSWDSESGQCQYVLFCLVSLNQC
jgi:ankyrin repeat protein